MRLGGGGAKYALLGASLALMLQTNYRFTGPVGIGELLALFYLVVVLGNRALTDGRFVFRKPDRLTLLYVAIVILLVTPMTVFSSVINTQGVSFRDLLAYLLTCALLLTLPRSERDIHTMATTFLCVLFMSICFQYVFGGSLAHYSLRFTGGAKNPNQLALYLSAAVVISAYLKSNLVRFVVVILAFFFGIISLSDAFLVFLAVSLLVLVALTIMPPRSVLIALPLLLFLSYLVFICSGVSESFLHQWELADEGGARVQLYISAIYAWLDTPFSMLFGHGAGSYSGMNGAFGVAEAHNTALDLATVAGIFGLFLFPIVPLWMAMQLMSQNYRFAPAVLMGLIAFAFFHFAGRHPIFWVSLVLIYTSLRQERAMQRLEKNCS